MATTTTTTLPTDGAAIMLAAELRGRIDGEVRFDRTSAHALLHRRQQLPDRAGRRRHPAPCRRCRCRGRAGGAHGVRVLPRGGGSALAGQTVGESLVIDFSKYMDRVLEVNAEERWVARAARHQSRPLNTQLKPGTGLMFGPDPSSGNRATLGGVVANNSTGSHSILYGMTATTCARSRCCCPTARVSTLDPSTVERGWTGRRAGALDDQAARLPATRRGADRARLSSPLAARDRLLARPVPEADEFSTRPSWSSPPRARWPPRPR